MSDLVLVVWLDELERAAAWEAEHGGCDCRTCLHVRGHTDDPMTEERERVARGDYGGIGGDD